MSARVGKSCDIVETHRHGHGGINGESQLSDKANTLSCVGSAVMVHNKKRKELPLCYAYTNDRTVPEVRVAVEAVKAVHRKSNLDPSTTALIAVPDSEIGTLKNKGASELDLAGPGGEEVPVNSAIASGSNVPAPVANYSDEDEVNVTRADKKQKIKEEEDEKRARSKDSHPVVSAINQTEVESRDCFFNKKPHIDEQALERLIRSTVQDASSLPRAKPSPPNRPDDKDGHYVYELGENLTPRFKILNKLGEGTFGRVIECWDRHLKQYCAIKIIRNIRKYRNAAMVELEVLKKLQKNDPDDTRHCVRLLDWFEYRNHICMVFERLGLSLYDFLLKNHYTPFDVNDVRDFAFQLLDAVGYVHSLNLVHTDLKPENILLRALEYVKVPVPNSKHSRRIPKSTEIKLIDFGSAAFVKDKHAAIVSTRHYRAPEVILGLGWSFACDLWSIGCILVELVTGIVLFNTHDNLEHLAMMEKILGEIPNSLKESADECKTKGFFDNSLLNWPQGETSEQSRKAVRKLSELRDLLLKVAPAKREELLELTDLVKKLMRFEASKRISADEALGHPFFINYNKKGEKQNGSVTR